jgi:RHS repeat-associated protein
MGRVRFPARVVAFFILGISSTLAFASGRKEPSRQESAGKSASSPMKTLTGQSRTELSDTSVLLVGGIESGAALKTAFLDTGSRLQTSGSLRHARAFHSATLLPNGSVLIFGGSGSDNAVVSQAEIFNSVTETFTNIPSIDLTPRTHHAATLLTDGRVLFAGGLDQQGQAISRIELWDFRTGEVSTLSVQLKSPRIGPECTLQRDGSVLLWGGQDENGIPRNDGEVIDPNDLNTRFVSRRGADSPESRSPYVEASIPQSGQTGVATNQLISLRFSEPLAMSSLNVNTISLRSSTGYVSVSVVPADDGILAFVTPQPSLDTNTTYTLTISGAKDPSGQVLPNSNVQFATGDAAEGGSIAFGGGTGESGATSLPSGNTGSNRGDAPVSDFRRLAMLKAPESVTALAGQALTLDGAPLSNVRIEIDSQFGVTDDTGRFLVQNVGSGHHVMIIDGTAANTKAASYGLFRVGVDLKAGRTNSLNYTVWMTPLDTGHEVSIPSPTTSDMVITNPNVPGLELHIPAGTTIKDARGHVVKRIGITGIPVSQPPFPLKQGVRYPVYFTIQPGGSTFESRERAWPKSVTNRGRGVTIHYQNYLSASPGSRFAFWSYDPEQKGWYVYGHGRVSPNAKDIAPEEGTQLWTFDGAMVSLPDNAPWPAPKPCSPGPAPCNPKPADPVDLQTGLFVYRKTDLSLNDVIPLVLSRTYRPTDSMSRAFGIGTSMSFDSFLIGDDNFTSEGYTYQDLVFEDGARVHFTRTSPCYNGYCDYANAIYEATSTPGEFYGATLQYFGSGPYSNDSTSGDYWQMTKKDGTIYIFPDSDNSSNPRAAAVQLIQDRHGNTVRFTRDDNPNNSDVLTRVTSPNGRWIQFTYDSQNRIMQAQDSAGRTVLYSYNAAGYLASMTDANGGVTRYEYDPNGNMVFVQDPRGITYIQNQYDGNGMITQQTLVDGGVYRFSYTLDAYGNVTEAQMTDPLNNITKADFNADGYMTSETLAQGKPEQQTITYNRQAGTGLLLSTTDALNRTTAYSYDAMANVTSTTQLSGTSSATTTTFGYDQRYYELSSVTDPLGNSTSFSYDSFGNMLSATDPLGDTTAFAYNEAGQPLVITDALGNEAQFGYDSGSLVSITDPLGRTSTRFVDDAGRVASTSDALNDTTTIAYDGLNQVTSTTDPMGNQTAFVYDGNGNLKSITDANQHQTKYDYDTMDRLIKRTDPLGNFESFTYDLNGNLKQATDRKSQLTTYSYDGLNRMTQVQFNDGSAVTNTYDAGNRVTVIADSQSGTISRGYDGLDRLLLEANPQGSVTYTYDTDGRRQTMSVSGQSPVSYNFNKASQLTSIIQGGASVSFGYDAAGRRTSLTLPNSIVATYSYDGASQLTGIVYQGGALAAANLGYTYDLAGRRTSMSGTLASTQLPAAVSSAVYNADNQLAQWGSTAMTYDLNGNMLNDDLNGYVWDARNRLVSANNNGATFAYDSLGRRIGKNVLSANTNYLYDGVNPVQELNGSTVTANLLTGGIDQYFARTDSTGTSNFLTDALGTAVELTDSGGNQQVKYSYGPFGAISITGTTNNSYTYTGREIDGLGLYYYRARYYNPSTGRFLTEDPMGFAGSGPNLYEYADDSPTNFTDPGGLIIEYRGDSTANAIAWDISKGYLNQDPGMASIINQLESSSTVYTIRANPYNIDQADYLQKSIDWDPNEAHECTGGGFQSPALILGHELAHLAGPRAPYYSDPQYDNLEEKRVITGPETAAANTLGECKRQNHRPGRKYYVPNPILH